MVDWEFLREKCVRTDEIIKIIREEALPLPDYLHKSDLGISKGAICQYRDDRPTNSLHIHEFPNYFLVHVDAFNPEYYPVAHGVIDTPGITLAIVAGAAAGFFLLKSIRNMSLLPSIEEEKD